MLFILHDNIVSTANRPIEILRGRELFTNYVTYLFTYLGSLQLDGNCCPDLMHYFSFASSTMAWRLGLILYKDASRMSTVYLAIVVLYYYTQQRQQKRALSWQWTQTL